MGYNFPFFVRKCEKFGSLILLCEFYWQGKLMRQMLTARRGQRPTVWLDWSEARKIMIGWSGYNMMRIKGKRGTGSSKDDGAPCPDVD